VRAVEVGADRRLVVVERPEPAPSAGQVVLDLSAPSLVLKEAEIRGALAYRRADFAEAIAFLAAGRVPTDELITASAGLERAEEMFQALVAPGNAHVKVVLEP
jgi:threonine dehydrogenase-like Zn-dependent dehydrogenase